MSFGAKAVEPPGGMVEAAGAASDFLKALAHEGRLRILCHLAEREHTVGELETLLDCRQAAVSQQLARLRMEGLVTSRREGKTIVYAVADTRVAQMLGLLQIMFCPERIGRE